MTLQLLDDEIVYYNVSQIFLKMFDLKNFMTKLNSYSTSFGYDGVDVNSIFEIPDTYNQTSLNVLDGKRLRRILDILESYIPSYLDNVTDLRLSGKNIEETINFLNPKYRELILLSYKSYNLDKPSIFVQAEINRLTQSNSLTNKIVNDLIIK